MHPDGGVEEAGYARGSTPFGGLTYPVQDPPPSAQQAMLEAQIQGSLDKELVNLGK